MVNPEPRITGGPAVHGVVGGLFVLAGLAGFLVAPDDEYPVVRTGRDCQRSQQAHRKGGKSDSPAMPQNRYDSARSRQFDPTVISRRTTVIIDR